MGAASEGIGGRGNCEGEGIGLRFAAGQNEGVETRFVDEIQACAGVIVAKPLFYKTRC